MQVKGLTLMYTEEIIEMLAQYKPKELLKTMDKLVCFWKEGVFIGNPKRLFESFKLISNKEQREEIKRKFQEWYSAMKKLNPKLERINWSEK